MTPTKEFDVVNREEGLTIEVPQSSIVMDAADSTVTLQATAAPVQKEPVPEEPVAKLAAPVIKTSPKGQKRPTDAGRPAPIAAVTKPQPKPAAPAVEEVLADAMELPSMATMLAPTVAGGGLMPSEIPDFFLRMPTGRALPTAKPVMPVAPLPLKAPKPAPAVVNSAESAVRIIDSSTPKNVEDELMTMTSIPDDWPS